MQTIYYQEFSNKLFTLIETINNEHAPLYLELPNAQRAFILSEHDYSGLMETLHLLSNPVNAEKLLGAVERSIADAKPWEQVKNDLAL